MEKILKALIIKKNKIKLNNELKRYSHNLKDLIVGIHIGPRQRIRLYRELAKIGNEFHHGFGLYKTKIRDSETKNFTEDEIKKHGCGLRSYSLFIDILQSAYFDFRYPKHEKLTSLHRMNLDTWVFCNIPICIATIRSFKVIQNFLGKSADGFLWQNFTWNFQQNYFEEPEKKTIETYKNMEEMICYILNKNKTMNLGEYIIKNDSYSLDGRYTIDQEGWS